jgi:hypothetical protein
MSAPPARFPEAEWLAAPTSSITLIHTQQQVIQPLWEENEKLRVKLTALASELFSLQGGIGRTSAISHTPKVLRAAVAVFRRLTGDQVHSQILRLCQKAAMVSLGHVALDGTKVQANASKHKAMSHERMLKAEKELEKEIHALMRRAEILDAQDDRRYGKGELGSELPDELRHKQGRLARIRQAPSCADAPHGSPPANLPLAPWRRR